MILFEHRGEPDPANSRDRKPGETRGRKKGSTPWNKGMHNGKKKSSLWSRVKRMVGLKESQQQFRQLQLQSQQEFEDIINQSKLGGIKKTAKKVGNFMNKNSGAIIATAAVGNLAINAANSRKKK